MAHDDAQIAGAERGGGFDVVEPPDGQDMRTDGPRVEHPSAERQHAHERERIGADHGHDGDGQHDHRESELDIRHAHDDGVGPPAAPAGHEAHEDTRHGGDQHRAHGQGERDSPAVEESREDVPAEVIGAEHVPARAAQAPGRSEALAEARLERIIRSQGGGEKAGEDHQPQERAADHHRRIAAPEASDRHGLELGRHHEYRMRGSSTV